MLWGANWITLLNLLITYFWLLINMKYHTQAYKEEYHYLGVSLSVELDTPGKYSKFWRSFFGQLFKNYLN